MALRQQPTALVVGLLMVSAATAQTDPGVRAGPINGQPGVTPTTPLALQSVISNNPAGILEFFDDGLDRFQEVDVVNPNGLGPRFNFNQCSGCHAQPAVGGSSPASNPQ